MGLSERLLVCTGAFFDSTVDLDTPVITLAPANNTIIEGQGRVMRQAVSQSRTTGSLRTRQMSLVTYYK